MLHLRGAARGCVHAEVAARGACVTARQLPAGAHAAAPRIASGRSTEAAAAQSVAVAALATRLHEGTVCSKSNTEHSSPLLCSCHLDQPLHFTSPGQESDVISFVVSTEGRSLSLLSAGR